MNEVKTEVNEFDIYNKLYRHIQQILFWNGRY